MPLPLFANPKKVGLWKTSKWCFPFQNRYLFEYLYVFYFIKVYLFLKFEWWNKMTPPCKNMKKDLLIFKNSDVTDNPSYPWKSRSSRLEVFCRKDVLRHFAKFTGKHLYQSLFFNKVAGQACYFIKKEAPAQVFSYEFCKISENTFFTVHLRGYFWQSENPKILQ